MSEETRILVVDDDEHNLNLLTRRLKRAGYIADPAEDGRAALKAIENASYSIVLLDLDMPEISGFDVLRSIRSKFSALDLPVIMVTANCSNETIIEAIGLGANDYVTKPFDFAVVTARIESQLNVKRAVESARVEMTPEPSIRLFDDRYEILERIGRGGYAFVYKARQLSTNQIVAVKILQTHRLRSDHVDVETARFEREMKVIGQIRHPNIVRLIDAGRASDTFSHNITDDGLEHPYIVMEYLAGESLLTRLRRQASFSVPEALAILLPVMDGVQAAHLHGVLHRDLKPANIFLSQRDNQTDAHPHVLDFGIASFTSNDPNQKLTQTSSVVGTPAYMSPEQARAKPLSAASDQYALAVLLYHCLAGRLPYKSRAVVPLLEEVARADYIPLSERQLAHELPFGLEAVLNRAMRRKPEERFESVAAFASALRYYLKS